jgi:MFS superfamily sulfate permease-like transporter
VLLTDLLTGVGLAVGLSVIDLFARLVRPHDAVIGIVPQLAGLHDVADWADARTLPGLVLFRFDAPLCFANAEHFRQRVLAVIAAETHPVAWFVLNAEAIVEIDITAADVLEELHRELSARGITFALAQVKQDLHAQLERAGLVERIGARLFFPTLPTAIAAFRARSTPAPGP